MRVRSQNSKWVILRVLLDVMLNQNQGFFLTELITDDHGEAAYRQQKNEFHTKYETSIPGCRCCDGDL
jgi:hypothetical protein